MSLVDLAVERSSDGVTPGFASSYGRCRDVEAGREASAEGVARTVNDGGTLMSAELYVPCRLGLSDWLMPLEAVLPVLGLVLLRKAPGSTEGNS